MPTVGRDPVRTTNLHSTHCTNQHSAAFACGFNKESIVALFPYVFVLLFTCWAMLTCYFCDPGLPRNMFIFDLKEISAVFSDFYSLCGCSWEKLYLFAYALFTVRFQSLCWVSLFVSTFRSSMCHGVSSRWRLPLCSESQRILLASLSDPPLVLTKGVGVCFPPSLVTLISLLVLAAMQTVFFTFVVCSQVKLHLEFHGFFSSYE